VSRGNPGFHLSGPLCVDSLIGCALYVLQGMGLNTLDGGWSCGSALSLRSQAMVHHLLGAAAEEAQAAGAVATVAVVVGRAQDGAGACGGGNSSTV
jgi:hypothetical protein